MLKFRLTDKGIDLEYKAENNLPGWVWRELQEKRSIELSQVFYYDKDDLINPPADADIIDDDYWYQFPFGTFEDEYVRISGRFLGIDNDVLLPKDTKFKRTLFAAERNISIFGRLAGLLEHKYPIVIGGTRHGAIPMVVYEELLDKFPNSYEVDRYAGARVTTILSQYLDGMKDTRGRYETYLNKKMAGTASMKIDLDDLKKLEIEKYVLIRELIRDALENKTNLTEQEWQKYLLSFLLLLFPKYIKVLENVTINDYYSRTDGKKTSRYIDLALLDANGNLDVIELKRSFENKILRKGQYRDNSIPTAELSGAVMQAEKYLFHLSKWGIQGERELTKRYEADIPAGMKIRISNPKAIIILGRDQMFGADMDDGQRLDFEVIKRKYANMMDIITYDDLLRRLDNSIVALGGETVIAKKP
ncbi:protein of unknown function [Aureimonas altamirensis DSM 21988]|uniref:Shedu protein SduA C-terminal domain-containing protein n=1 Tax=Aureimonas altamirensis DSM 21988 TaxID=1121026 RepID=A0ABY1IQV7_9HYPH|nr:Shedu immune nuclease family protein [Aureimonas altamirensis]SHJ95204.1 protein of unknown function [Aureimonas altamirensis DSM 21988]